MPENNPFYLDIAHNSLIAPYMHTGSDMGGVSGASVAFFGSTQRWMSTMPWFNLAASNSDDIRGVQLDRADLGGFLPPFSRNNDYQDFFIGATYLMSSSPLCHSDQRYSKLVDVLTDSDEPEDDVTNIHQESLVFDLVNNEIKLDVVCTENGVDVYDDDAVNNGCLRVSLVVYEHHTVNTATVDIVGPTNDPDPTRNRDITLSIPITHNDVRSAVTNWLAQSDTFKDATYNTSSSLVYSDDDDTTAIEMKHEVDASFWVQYNITSFTATPAFQEGAVNPRLQKSAYGNHTFGGDYNDVYNFIGNFSFTNFSNNEITGTGSYNAAFNSGSQDTSLSNLIPEGDKYVDEYGVFGDSNAAARSEWRSPEAGLLSSRLSYLRNMVGDGKYAAIKLKSNSGTRYRVTITGYFVNDSEAFSETLTMNSSLEAEWEYDYTSNDPFFSTVSSISYSLIEVYDEDSSSWITKTPEELGVSFFSAGSQSVCGGLWRESFKLRDGSRWGHSPLDINASNQDDRYRTKTESKYFDLQESTHPDTSENRPCHVGGSMVYSESVVSEYNEHTGELAPEYYSNRSYVGDGVNLTTLSVPDLPGSLTTTVDTPTLYREEIDVSSVDESYVSFGLRTLADTIFQPSYTDETKIETSPLSLILKPGSSDEYETSNYIAAPIPLHGQTFKYRGCVLRES